MKKQLAVDLYCPCLGIIRRLAIYQKDYETRIHYNWPHLWSTLLALIKFLCHEDQAKNADNLRVAEEIINLLNVFITHGHRIFPLRSLPLKDQKSSAEGEEAAASAAPQCVAAEYDQLFYEIIHNSTVVRTFVEWRKHTPSPSTLLRPSVLFPSRS